MLILSRADLRQCAPMTEAITAVTDAFAQLSSGQAEVPLRLHMHVPPHNTGLFMPAYLGNGAALGIKALTITPDNPARNLPVIQALVLLFDAATGQPVALMDGGYLTALRTGASSGASTQLMARPNAAVLALFGAGAQAFHQVWAVCAVRPIQRVYVVNRTVAKAERLADELRAFGAPIPADIQIVADPNSVLAEADVVCTATAATAPLFADTALKPGTHISAVGAYTPQMQEVPPETLARARIAVDQRGAAWAEGGDLVKARDLGLISEANIVADLGELALGRVPGRTSADEITFFKSVGNAVQDVAVAQVALRNARTLGLGTEVTL